MSTQIVGSFELSPEVEGYGTVDHLFVTENARIIRHRFATCTQAVNSSDHYPVFIDVELGK